MRFVAILILTVLAGCNVAAKNPGAIQCQGKATLTAVGSVTMLGAGDGTVTFDCGDGAFIRQGADVTPPPTP